MLWSTVYLQRAIQAIKDHGHPAATNALDNKADIAKVQEWLGHANVSTTRLYDARRGPSIVRRFESGIRIHVED